MTSPEHTLVGILGAFSVGLHRRLGWPAVVMSAVASNVPDLDGIPMLFDMERFEAGHRVWGHNALAILVTSLLVAFSQYQFRWIEKISWRLNHLLPSETAIGHPDAVRRIDFIPLLVICVCFQSIHLACDMTVSGGSGLSNWEVKPLWPFNHTGIVFPLIPWGDVGRRGAYRYYDAGGDRHCQASACWPHPSVNAGFALCVHAVSWIRARRGFALRQVNQTKRDTERLACRTVPVGTKQFSFVQLLSYLSPRGRGRAVLLHPPFGRGGPLRAGEGNGWPRQPTFLPMRSSTRAL